MRKNNTLKAGIVAAVAAGLFVPTVVNASVMGGKYVDDPLSPVPSVEVSVSDEDAAALKAAGFDLDLEKMNELLDKQLDERPDQRPAVPVITKGETTAPNTHGSQRYEDGRWLAIGSGVVGTQDSLPELDFSEGDVINKNDITDPAEAFAYVNHRIGNTSLGQTRAAYEGQEYRSVEVPARSAWAAGAYDDPASYLGGKDADVAWFSDNYIGEERDEDLKAAGAEFPSENAAVIYDNDDAGFWIQGLQAMENRSNDGTRPDQTGVENYTLTDPIWVDVDSTFGYETPVEGKNWDKEVEDVFGGIQKFSLKLSDERSRPSSSSEWVERGERDVLPSNTQLNFTAGEYEEGVLTLHYNAGILRHSSIVEWGDQKAYVFNAYLKDGLDAEKVGVVDGEEWQLIKTADHEIRVVQTYHAEDNRIEFRMVALDKGNPDVNDPQDFPRVEQDPSLEVGSGANSVYMNHYDMGGYELVRGDVSYPEPETPEPTTPAPETPEPTTPAPTTPTPETPEPTTPAPEDPEPTTPEEPKTPEPKKPETPDTPAKISAGVEDGRTSAITAAAMGIAGLFGAVAYRLRARGGRH